MEETEVKTPFENHTLPGEVKPKMKTKRLNHFPPMTSKDEDETERKTTAGNGKKKGKKKDQKKNNQSDENWDWDCAEEKPMHGANDDEGTFWQIFTQIGLVVSAIALFVIVFGSACLSRIIIHVMIWKLNPPLTETNFAMNKLGGVLKPKIERMSLNCSDLSTSDCLQGYYVRNGLPDSWKCTVEPYKCVLREDPPSVNVAWIWGLLIIMSAPYFYTIIVSMWRICFKKNKLDKFQIKMFLLSLAVELTHATGLCIMVFLVMPAFDPLSASILSYFVCIFPTVLSLRFQVRQEDTKYRKQRQRENINSTVTNNQQTNDSTSTNNPRADNSTVTNNPHTDNSTVTNNQRTDDSTVTNNQSTVTNNPRTDNSTVTNNPRTDNSTVTNNQRTDDSTVTNNPHTNLRYPETPFLGGLLFLIGLVFLCLYVYYSAEDENVVAILVLLLISICMVSVIWWENFVTSNINQNSEAGKQSFLKDYVKSKREKVSVLVYLLKIAWIFLVTLIIYVIQSKGESTLDTARTFLYLDEAATVNTLSGAVRLESSSYITYGCMTLNPYMMSLICLILTLIFFKMARYACRVVLQRKCFSLPIILNLFFVPLFFIIIMRYPLPFTAEGCNVLQPLWELDFNSSIERVWPLIASGCLGLLSVIILTTYIWSTGGSKMEKVERLFMKPAYCGIFLDLSLLLSRRRTIDNSDFVKHTQQSEEKPQEVYSPMVYFCATMWHETENEMTQLLKSIFRVDMDQCWRRQDQANKQMQKGGYYDEDIYDFEVHIFFDDAFKPRKVNGKPGKGRHVNEYVKLLEKCVPNTAKLIYGNYELDPVKKYETPYGMKFEWTMLTDSAKLIVHLKDKQKIRNRKRWSQVMYMYYLLAFELNKLKPHLDLQCQELSKSVAEMVHNLSENTFLLALDGDVDFKPEAVTLLLDLMRKNTEVGAACGRIHPIGSGPMVWYQKFEYAVSHWLQKATEHVIGCVLCSPGCFSLFRGSAVLADNVLKTYTRQATEAEHHIQYDQGEDRWLCTLMLKEGFRVEYCAASDALTFAPEGFFEFYKQRRRWAPSTMANILDLLLDWKYVKKNNDSISMLYIIYHIFLFVSSLLTPGTIFLLIMGAIITAFPAIQPWLALVLNMLPVGVLIVSIFLTKEDTQLMLAGIISTIYSLVMMVVLIGLIKEGVESQFCSVTTVFFCFVAGVFIVAALIHPQEFTCLFHGVLYFLAVPSMSMLLILYSIGNMHNINWGTRENKSADSQETVAKRKSKFEGHTCSIGEWCRCMLCVREVVEPMPQDAMDYASDNPSDDDKPQQEANDKEAAQKTTTETEQADRDNTLVKKLTGDNKGKVKKGDFKNCMDLLEDENVFWTRLIKKYLKPTVIKPAEQERVKKELEELRNKVFFFVFIINALFVTIVYVLTQVNSYQGTLEIPLPCNVAGGKQGKIEPISIAFTLTFGLLLLIQFFGMIYHRISTFTHIIASTRLDTQKQIRRPNLRRKEEETTTTKREEESKTPDANNLPEHLPPIPNKGWNKIKGGIKASSALRSISGESKNRPEKLNELKNKIKEETIISDENKDILSQFSDTPVGILSMRTLKNSLKNDVQEDIPGTSKD